MGSSEIYLGNSKTGSRKSLKAARANKLPVNNAQICSGTADDRDGTGKVDVLLNLSHIVLLESSKT